MIRITAKQPNFRRAGIAHSVTPTEYPDNHFTAEQLAALKAEPMLVVEIVETSPGDDPPPPPPPPDPPAGKKRTVVDANP